MVCLWLQRLQQLLQRLLLLLVVIRGQPLVQRLLQLQLFLRAAQLPMAHNSPSQTLALVASQSLGTYRSAFLRLLESPWVEVPKWIPWKQPWLALQESQVHM